MKWVSVASSTYLSVVPRSTKKRSFHAWFRNLHVILRSSVPFGPWHGHAITSAGTLWSRTWTRSCK
eukprot:1415792-Rhodomonas_salina.1